MRKTKEFFRGCLIGGAIGDALGWPVEFMKLDEIKEKYGDRGIINLILGGRGRAEITDDTQMTLFTAEGLLRAETRGYNRGIIDIKTCVYNAYLRWLYTQDGKIREDRKNIYDGYLIKQKELYVRRAPGMSCLMSLSSGDIGTVDDPINNSKGCGGVMRVAPVGLFYRKKLAFSKAVDCAAITHGHPLGYLSAGTLAYIISCIIQGMDLEDSILEAIEELKKYNESEKVIELVSKAIKLSNCKKTAERAIGELGEGWVAEEALAISIYCSLKYRDNFEEAIVAAVNHNGDSDSTGAITGNILGAYLGINAIPNKWVKKIELLDVIRQVADDIHIGYSDENEWWIKYPGY